jgi:N-acetylneuraminic acid mutarotase
MNKYSFTLLKLPRIFPLLLLGAGLALVQPSSADPSVFTPTGSVSAPRYGHTATLLQNGKVLMAGGSNGTTAAPGEQLYDPANGTWMPTGSLHVSRYRHTATVLFDGKVLVAGGSFDIASAEIYDPINGTWTLTGNMRYGRYGHTATLLSDGRVLVAGGLDSATNTSKEAEIYDPSTGVWRLLKSLTRARAGHTATLLPNGMVLVAGGANNNGVHESAELFDPSTETWQFTGGNMNHARANHTATLLPSGKVLVTAGNNNDNPALGDAELYDPSTQTWAFTGNLSASVRYGHKAALLPSGRVLVIGGSNSGNGVASAELYDPSTAQWTTTGSPHDVRNGLFTVTLLSSGKVLVVGGINPLLATAELYDPSTGGTWFSTAIAPFARALHTATLLPNGQVLAAGGTNGDTTLGSTSLYDPPTSSWLATTSLNGARQRHTATLLPDGKVLVAGGTTGSSVLASAELYDRSNATWTNTGGLSTSRYDHTATLLANGNVLVTGGVRPGTLGVPTYVSSAELYNPASGLWTATTRLTTARHYHTATLLLNGKVLVTGGSNANNNYLGTSELYDPSTGAWTATGSLAAPRELHTATLLPDGRVLVAGGNDDANGQGIFLSSVEIYNPATGTWTAGPSLGTAREGHSATLMPDGRVLVVAGAGNGNTYLTDAELFDPSIGKWTAAGSNSPRLRHTATLLPNGRVLAVGGFFASGAAQTNTAFYDPGFNFLRPTWQPQISSAFSTSALDGLHLFLAGSRLQGISQASGGYSQESATNYPVVQLRSIDNGQEVFLQTDPAFGWSDRLFQSTVITGFPFGPALVTVFANGIPSDAFYLSFEPPPTPGLLGNISTRLRVETGDNVLIGGFIVTGTQPKKVIIRALGPSVPLPGTLADPILELRDSSGALIQVNDNWRSDHQAEIIATMVQPSNDLESAIVATLPANGASYTAIVRGVNGGTGVGLVEVYDLDPTANSKLANISTRGLVQTGDNVLIAGTIVLGTTSQRVLVRAIGPSLPVPGKLQDPTLELRDGNGALLRSNDNWRSDQEAEIIATTIPPSSDLESALIATLPSGGATYTAIVRGVNSTTGIAVVEVYAIN